MNLYRMRPTRTAILMLMCCSHSLAQTDNTQSSTPLNPNKELSPAQRIKAEVQRLGVQYRMPAMFAAYQTIGQPLIGYAGGRRKRGSDVRVTLEDKIHLGSCTKAMTATMIARLIERGAVDLTWNTTIEQGLPELSQLIDPSFLSVTLQQLLMHRGGCPGQTEWTVSKRDSITQTRRDIVQAELSIRPKTTPGNFEYSNLGYVVAALMVTQATGKPWEQLMQEEIFDPLELNSAGFGPPGTPDKEDQPWGHSTVLMIQLPLQEDNTVYLAATTIANDEVGAGLDQIFEPMIRIRRDTKNDSPAPTQ